MPLPQIKIRYLKSHKTVIFCQVTESGHQDAIIKLFPCNSFIREIRDNFGRKCQKKDYSELKNYSRKTFPSFDFKKEVFQTLRNTDIDQVTLFLLSVSF